MNGASYFYSYCKTRVKVQKRVKSLNRKDAKTRREPGTKALVKPGLVMQTKGQGAKSVLTIVFSLRLLQLPCFALERFSLRLRVFAVPDCKP
jgi:hypothetical protein